MFKLLRRLRTALGAAAIVGALFGAGAAAAQGGVQVDTSTFSTSKFGASSGGTGFCVLGQACNTFVDVGFNIKLGTGVVTRDIYMYEDGIIGVGSALPTGATLGDPSSLGHAYIAASFADYSGTTVHATVGLAGGPDHNLPPGENDWTLVDWFVDSPTQGLGEYQIKFITFQNYPPIDPSVPQPPDYSYSFGFHAGGGQGDPGIGAEGLYWPGSGMLAGYYQGFDLSGLPADPGVPEPAAWALMIGGFFVVGAALRRRAPAPA